MHNAFRRLAWLDTRDFNFIMDIMAGWLSRTIQRDLSEAMELASGQKANSMQDKYEDDGSNLRVRASKPGVVQIIKVSWTLLVYNIFSNFAISCNQISTITSSCGRSAVSQ